MKAYSQDLRIRVIRAVQSGLDPLQAALTFQISLSTVNRLRKLLVETGSLDHKKQSGRKPLIKVENQPAFLVQLEAHSDATLEEHCFLWSGAGYPPITKWTAARAIKRLNWTRKKKDFLGRRKG